MTEQNEARRIAGDRRDHLLVFGALMVLTVVLLWQSNAAPLAAATAFLAGYALNSFATHPHLMEVADD